MFNAIYARKITVKISIIHVETSRHAYFPITVPVGSIRIGQGVYPYLHIVNQAAYQGVFTIISQ